MFLLYNSRQLIKVYGYLFCSFINLLYLVNRRYNKLLYKERVALLNFSSGLMDVLS